MFIVLGMGATDKQGACLNNTGGDYLRSGLAWVSDDVAVGGPEKGHLSEAFCCSDLASAACFLAVVR
jgi:hypothetical protein